MPGEDAPRGRGSSSSGIRYGHSQVYKGCKISLRHCGEDEGVSDF